MHQVKGQYKDNETHYFYLDADQGFNYSTWSAPITWKGTVSGIEVEFIQIDNAAYDTSCFDWTGFPDGLEIAKVHLVKAIDDAMRIMD